MLISEIENLNNKYKLSFENRDNYFEPGMMEYLDKYYGSFDSISGEILIRFPSKGTRYEGRLEEIERVKVGESIKIVRDADNSYNSNNFTIETSSMRNLGNMPAELCNAIAPLFDDNKIEFISSNISYVEPISKRSRYARESILFIELKAKVKL